MKKYKDNFNSSKKPIKAATDYESLKSDYRYDSYDNLSPEDCLDGFVFNYSTSDSYIGDAISEQADSSVDIYNSELCKSCWDLYKSGAYEEAKSNGLLEGADDLMKLLQACQFEFYEMALYENLDAVMRNLVLSYLEENDIEVSDEQWENVCDEFLTDVDNNDRISTLCEKVADAINGEDYEDEEE